MRIRSKLRWTVALVAVASTFALTACREIGTGPQPHEQQFPKMPALKMPSAPMFTVYGDETSNGDTAITTFTYDPASSEWYAIAGNAHALYLPSYSVCDPETSGYGPEYWDAPCEPLTSGLQITAKTYHDANGWLRIDFSPAIRFMPGRFPTLYMHEPQAAIRFNTEILYCGDDDIPLPGPLNGLIGWGSCVDESAGDPYLDTEHAPGSGYVYRVIKHFSGYEVPWT